MKLWIWDLTTAVWTPKPVGVIFLSLTYVENNICPKEAPRLGAQNTKNSL